MHCDGQMASHSLQAMPERAFLEGIVERRLRLEEIRQRYADGFEEFPQENGTDAACRPLIVPMRWSFELHGAGTPADASRSDT
jgi:hypothetical protein